MRRNALVEALQGLPKGTPSTIRQGIESSWHELGAMLTHIHCVRLVVCVTKS